MQRIERRLWPLLLCAVGCAPLVPPAQWMETPEVLGRKEVSIGAGGGLGVVAPVWGGAVGARLRVGVGARQEVGIEGLVSLPRPGAEAERGLVGGKLSWKVAPVRWLGIVAGLGFAQGLWALEATAFGGDIGVVFSTPTALEHVRPYVAVRGVLSGTALNHTIVCGPMGSAGLALEFTPSLRLFVEMGGGAYVLADAGSPWDTEWHSGYYGGISLAWRFLRR